LKLVPNAGDRMRRCLESVQWSDDIFCIVDPKTSDGSDDVAREFSDHVVVHEYVNKANQCNWAIPQIETEWTLVLDADEWVSDELADRIRAVIAAPGGPNGYTIKRNTLFMGKWIRFCGLNRDYNVRLFRTQKGRYQELRVHASIDIEGEMGRIDEPMLHDDKRDFDEYFRTFQRFTTWAAQDRFHRGKRCSLADLTLRPVARFIKTYVLQQGFRDGYHGAVYAGLGAFNVFTKYAKLWYLQQQDSSS